MIDPNLVAKVLCDAGAPWLVARRAIAIRLVAPKHHPRSTEQVEVVAPDGDVAVVAVEQDGLPIESLEAAATDLPKSRGDVVT
eukprot:COSAG01_NODE_4277_length_5187_cov_2.244890_4_plen_83_part_00